MNLINAPMTIDMYSKLYVFALLQEEEMNFGGFPAYDKLPYEKRIPGKLEKGQNLIILTFQTHQYHPHHHSDQFDQQWWGAQT